MTSRQFPTQEVGTNNGRVTVNYFEGVNGTVQHMLSKKQEFSHMENARAGTIGSIEKRGGQAKYGTNTSGNVFEAGENYGLFNFENDGSNLDLFRVSSNATVPIVNPPFVPNVIAPDPNILFVQAADYVNIVEPKMFSKLDSKTIIIDGTSENSFIYSLNSSMQWSPLSDSEAQNIIGSDFDTVSVDGNLLMTNQKDYNRLIQSDGTTVVDSNQPGSLYNSPRARHCTFYKNRIYLADFFVSGNRNKTTVSRSSYPLGIIALINGDSTGAIIPVTDIEYFYADNGMNYYEIYRGPNKIADIYVSSIQSTTITAAITYKAGFSSFLAADEIWIGGTYSGKKQYRWPNNSTSTGQDVKQYGTIKLSGGDESAITLFEPIGNVLIVANKNSFLTWNDYSLTEFDQGIGCVSNYGFTKLIGSLYFIHYSGIFSTNGSTPTLLSRKVEQYIKGATKSGLENATAGFKGLSVFFAIGDVTLYNNDGSFWKVLKDTCLEYNVADQIWFVHTNVPAKKLTTFLSEDGKEHLLMEHTGVNKSIKEFLVGNNDDGETIFFRVDMTPIQLMNEIELLANPIAVSVESERGSLIRCFANYDNNGFYELNGSFQKGISTIKVTAKNTTTEQSIFCHWLQLSFRESSAQTCKIIQTSIIYTPTTVTQVQ